MGVSVPPKQRVHRIVRRLACYSSELPPHFELEPSETPLGMLWGPEGIAECIVTDRGALFRSRGQWVRFAYADIEAIFPAKTDSDGALTLCTPCGSFSILRGSRELWEVGRFFMRCADDAKMV